MATVRRTILALTIVLSGLGGCERGSVTLRIEAPGHKSLSPFADPRRDTALVIDELTGKVLGGVVDLAPPRGPTPGTAGPVAIGDIPIGHYDMVQLRVEGATQLIGVGRTPDVDLRRGVASTVVIHVRKPLLYFLSQFTFGVNDDVEHVFDIPWPTNSKLPHSMRNGPGFLFLLDPTVPLALPGADLPGCSDRNGCNGVSATTPDGLHVVVALPGRVLVVATGSLYDPGDDRIVGEAALEKAPGQASPALPRRVALDPTSGMVAILTDQGVNFASLPAIGNPLPSLPTHPLPGATALAWRLEGGAVTVLTGPGGEAPRWSPWEPALCTDPGAAQIRDLSLDGVFSATVAAPPSTSDIAYDAFGNLLFAVPCEGGLVPAGPGQKAIVEGSSIARVLVEHRGRDGRGGRIVAVPGNLTTRGVNDPIKGVVSTAALHVLTPPATAPVPPAEIVYNRRTIEFEVAAELFPTTIGGKQVLVKVQPTGLLAYDFATSADGSRVVMATRARYTADDYRFFQVRDDPNDKDRVTYYCALDVVRDVFRMVEFDLARGNLAIHDEVKGQQEVTPCRFSCNRWDPVKGYETQVVENRCALSDGFAPGGFSLAFGSY